MRFSLLLAAALVSAPALAADADAGASIYAAKCQACHGKTGQGDGPAAGALPKKPLDWTQPTFWDGMTDAKLEASIRNGKPGSAMRGFPMKAEQMANLIAYINGMEPAVE